MNTKTLLLSILLLGVFLTSTYGLTVHKVPSCQEDKKDRGWFWDGQKCEECAHKHCTCNTHLGCDATKCYDNEIESNDHTDDESKGVNFANDSKRYNFCKSRPACPTGCAECCFEKENVSETARCSKCSTGYELFGHYCYKKDEKERSSVVSDSELWNDHRTKYFGA